MKALLLLCAIGTTATLHAQQPPQVNAQHPRKSTRVPSTTREKSTYTATCRTRK
ncbi:hypothetical protein ACQ86N_37850 [Puia sp. P3]|uniref:hypothetical protein n=1 Tax=Puia sp. P3 TaxID=3423952 RepID=UPI003D671E92